MTKKLIIIFVSLNKIYNNSINYSNLNLNLSIPFVEKYYLNFKINLKNNC